MKKKEESFGQIVRSIRQNRKMTQKMLAQDICSQSVLSRIENNEELPNVWVMYQICQRLGVTLDQVMMLHSEEINQSNQVFAQIESHFVHKRYQALLEKLQDKQIKHYLYLDTDMQMYYYYLGSCAYFIDQDYEGALVSLKKGLSYTYQQDKTNVSVMEIRLLSCMGRVYSDLQQLADARLNLEKSYDSMQALPPERLTTTLTKVYYNYAVFLKEQGELCRSLKIIEEGIALAREKNSFYFLEELFEIKAQVLTFLKEEQAANKSFRLYQAVVDIRQSAKMV
ncbi:helix-turn-helix transcriptional regulator [Enterococcus sp.]|uniref:helix-turn-helix domain-containing protein n=1 Tax=Enterococcus sp. TaxID=35783 RepID=UPI0028AAC048|nr:helix-turn-helix transcriptional regulator [Enterococcus sp.]